MPPETGSRRSRTKAPSVAFVEEALRRPLPGYEAQWRMISLPAGERFPYGKFEPTCLKAGVLLLLYPGRGGPRIVFIRRTSTVLHHKDQISFPGGQVEGRETYEEAALREAREEIGVRPDAVRILGSLTPLYVPPSNFCIYPFVGAAARRPRFVPDPREVAEIIEAPLAHFLEPAHAGRECRTLEGAAREIAFYALGRDKIWGATAMVLAELVELLRGARGAPGKEQRGTALCRGPEKD